MKTDVLGVRFDGLTMEQAVERALSLMCQRKNAYVCTPNPEIVWAARTDTALKKAIDGAAMVLPDGVGVVWAAKRLRSPLPERVAGYDFLRSLLGGMEGSVFLLGGRPGVAEEAAETIRAQYPRVTVVGCADGYFTDEAAVRRQIKTASPDLLAVCLGSPKQELWMAENASSLPVGLMAGLGGSLDVMAGRVARAPQKWIDLRLEWLYRLLREPRRIKRQIRLLYFAAAVLIQRKSHDKG